MYKTLAQKSPYKNIQNFGPEVSIKKCTELWPIFTETFEVVDLLLIIRLYKENQPHIYHGIKAVSRCV
jgi:hypothetical protein